MFKTYKDKKRWNCSVKTPQNYEKIRYDVLLFEQKQIKIDDDFNETEEKEIKECVEKRKLKMRELAEKKYNFEKKKKQEKNKKKRLKCGLD